MKKLMTIVCMLLATMLAFSGLILAENAATGTVTNTNVTSTDVTGTDVVVLGYGDLDGKKGVNAGDALIVLKVAVGKMELTAEQFEYADVYKDGKINARDALVVLQYAVDKIDSLPVIPSVTGTDVTGTDA